jgi:hypothetical protein
MSSNVHTPENVRALRAETRTSGRLQVSARPHSDDPIWHIHPLRNWRLVDLAVAGGRSDHRFCATALDCWRAGSIERWG